MNLKQETILRVIFLFSIQIILVFCLIYLKHSSQTDLVLFLTGITFLGALVIGEEILVEIFTLGITQKNKDKR